MSFDATLKNAIPLFALLVTLSGFLLAATHFETALFAPAALILYVLLMVYILRVYPVAFVLLLWFVFIRFTVMISGIAIEGGGYMHETLLDGAASGAFMRLAAIYTIGIVFLCALIGALTRRVRPLSSEVWGQQVQRLEPWIMGIFIGAFVFCALAFWVGLQNGFPLLTGVDRILYWRVIDNRFFYFFLGNRVIFALLLGLVYGVASKGEKRIAIGLFAMMMACSFLFAEKFTSIAVLLFAFVTPVFLLKRDLLNMRKIMALGGALCVLTIPAILVVYGVADDPSAAVDRFASRVVSQGQLWFYADQAQGDYLALDPVGAVHNIRAMVSLSPDAIANTAPHLGVKDFMAQTMEADRYAHYIERGVTLTMGMEAYLLQLFGWVGMVPAYLVLLGVYGAQLAYLYYAVQKMDPLRIILIAKLLVWTNFGLNQGYIWFIIGVKPLALMGCIALLEFLYRFAAKKRMGAAYVA